MSNYPPGAKNDPRAPYNQPDRSHDHKWEPCRKDSLILEDNAAIFHQRCNYAEGRYGEGWECEKERYHRIDAAKVVKVRDGEPNITYLVDQDNNSRVNALIEEVIISVEMNPDDCEILDVDPPGYGLSGFVKVQYGDYQLIYE